MKPQIANLKPHNIPDDCSPGRETKHWWQKLGYCSVFASFPTMLASPVLDARSNEATEPKPTVAGQKARHSQKLNISGSNPSLLKKQSGFLLPHQKGIVDLLLGGTDDCPGRAIPGGIYTSVTPFVDSGDTTGANDTVGSICSGYYCYYSTGTAGADHVYSFTITALGPNPRIEVSSSSQTHSPIIYVLDSRQGCPASTGGFASNLWWLNSFDNKTVFLQFAPVNVPLHLFVDSSSPASIAGPYTIRLQDVSIASATCPNPIDCPESFVSQHYFDFLNRVPDQEGLAFWTNEITSCGADPQCAEVKRINVSAAFFLSIEFQESGYLVYRMYKAAYGDLPQAPVPIRRQEFLPDTQLIGRNVVVGKPGWEQQLLNNKNAFATEFVRRSRFINTYSALGSDQFFDRLNENAGGPFNTAERNQIIAELVSGAKTRAQVLRAVAEHPDFARREFNKAFVLMQYFGYLHRNPNDAPDGNFDGYIFWLNKLDQFNGNFIEAEMVRAFIDSIEYRQRFGAP